ncbi:MAG TPA: hypothetical protein VF920_05245 [Dongiaceae bacterium]
MTRQLSPELERRVAVLEDPAQQGADFDGSSWFWLILLGIVGPLALLVWGWNA